MRILFSLLDAGVGGGQTMALSVAERLIADGHSVGVLVPTPGAATDRFLALGATVHTADLHSLRRIDSVGRAARALRGYEVLYSHTSIPGEILGDAAARLAGRRHVVHRHTPPHLSPNLAIREVHKALYRLLLSRRSIIAVAPHVAGALVALGVPRKNITVIANGVDIDSLPGSLPSDPASPLRFGVLGRVDPQKGMDVFAEALRLLRRDDLHAEFAVGVAKGGFPEYERRVLASLERQGVEIVDTGSNGPSFLAGLDLVVMPSRWEGSPLTLFEALALGKPVIASDIPGISEVLTSEDAGRLVPASDPSALADAMREAIHDASARARWSQNALRIATAYTRDRSAAKAVEVLASSAKRC